MFVKRKVLHHDGKTIVIARGLIQNDVFNGEYRFEGFTWGVEIPLAVVKPTYVDVAQKQLLANANLNLKNCQRITREANKLLKRYNDGE